MRDYLIQVSYLWTQEVKRYSQRFLVLQNMFLDMMKDLPPDRVAYWKDQLRTIDTRRRLIYDGPQVTQNQQPNNSCVTGTSNRPQGQIQVKEFTVGDEEE